MGRFSKQEQGQSDLDLEFSELTGFSSGRAAALLDWSFRKDQAEFRRLVRSLRKRQRRARLTESEHRLIAALAREWRAAQRAKRKCVECSLASAPGSSRCVRHRAAQRIRQAKFRSRRGMHRRRFLTLRFNGRTQRIAAWAKETGLPFALIQSRAARGMTPEDCLSPVRFKTGFARMPKAKADEIRKKSLWENRRTKQVTTLPQEGQR